MTYVGARALADLLIGIHFRVETDQLPLVPLLSTKLLDELPIRTRSGQVSLRGRRVVTCSTERDY